MAYNAQTNLVRLYADNSATATLNTSGFHALVTEMIACGMMTATQAATDPGALGANTLWYKPDSGLASAGVPAGDSVLYRRDSTNAAWVAFSPSEFANYIYTLAGPAAATQAEVDAGVVSNKYVSPSTLNGRGRVAYFDSTQVAVPHATYTTYTPTNQSIVGSGGISISGNGATVDAVGEGYYYAFITLTRTLAADVRKLGIELYVDATSWKKVETPLVTTSQSMYLETSFGVNIVAGQVVTLQVYQEGGTAGARTLLAGMVLNRVHDF